MKLTRWKVVEKPCGRDEAAGLAGQAFADGAAGAVTSWGSGISHRETVRLFWEADAPPKAPEKWDFQAAEDLVEEDWSRYWKDSLSPFSIGGEILLKPAWDKDEDGAHRITLRIDPGMAFGAGDHPTTRRSAGIILEMADRKELPGRVLDVGAGTGVLSLLAAKLGRVKVDALDIDPFCYASVRRNAKLNGLSSEVRPLLLSLDLLPGSYPLVMANVVSRQLEAMALLLYEKVSPGGHLLLSGFDQDGEERVLRAIGPEFKVVRREVEEGWVALLARRTVRD